MSTEINYNMVALIFAIGFIVCLSIGVFLIQTYYHPENNQTELPNEYNHLSIGEP